MLVFLMLGVLGIALIGSTSDDASDEVEEIPEPETGEQLQYDGGDFLQGTAGNDTLSSDLPDGLTIDEITFPTEIRLGDGDDQATFDQGAPIDVFGENGNDTLISEAGGETLNGGDGNDVLQGSGGSTLSGGDGNDLITLDTSGRPTGLDSYADGGSGNDVIVFSVDGGSSYVGIGGYRSLSGGDGEDVFDVTLNLVSEITSQDGLDFLRHNAFTITDFNPDEDTLSIELARDQDSLEREVSELQFNQTFVDGTFVTRIVLTYEETEVATAAASYIQILSTSPFSVDDIEIVCV